MEFKEFDLAPEILQTIEEKGYTAPTPIQQQAIPALLSGEDLLGCAQTGTGKTAAFALPILQKLFASWDYKHQIRALILTPTRELALQIYENFLDYGKHLPLRCCVIFGGVSQNPQTQQLKEGVDVLIATPGRLLDLMGQGFISLKHTEYYVLDEADRMLDMGFLPDVRRITGKLPQDRQTMLFSATMPPEIARLAQKLLHNPVEINVSPVSRPVELIAQRVYLVDKGNKSKLLAHLIHTLPIPQALVFVRTKHGADRVARHLNREGITAQAIHGDKTQNNRQRALQNFKDWKIQVLVATDIAARGIDIEEMPYVINYDMPSEPETYVHRIGRTGRAGAAGTAISFCDEEEKAILRDVEMVIGELCARPQSAEKPAPAPEKGQRRHSQSPSPGQEGGKTRPGPGAGFRHGREKAGRGAVPGAQAPPQKKTEKALFCLLHPQPGIVTWGSSPSHA